MADRYRILRGDAPEEEPPDKGEVLEALKKETEEKSAPVGKNDDSILDTLFSVQNDSDTGIYMNGASNIGIGIDAAGQNNSLSITSSTGDSSSSSISWVQNNTMWNNSDNLRINGGSLWVHNDNGERFNVAEDFVTNNALRDMSEVFSSNMEQAMRNIAQTQRHVTNIERIQKYIAAFLLGGVAVAIFLMVFYL